VIARHHRPFWHTVAAAMRDADGRIWTGLHLGATVGRLSVCAEPIALGRAIQDGASRIVTVVAVRHHKPDELPQEITVVTPCGACRELLMDYAPDCMVIVSATTKVAAASLLPLPYRR
jgi:cytidine deaminase